MTVAAAPVPPPSNELNEVPDYGNCFVAAYPPFSAWSRNGLKDFQHTLESHETKPIGIYVHLPFCPQKCDYCYYLSYTKQSASVVDRYLDNVTKELELYAQFPGIKSRPVKFVYFGGGTPSTLSSKQVAKLVGGLRSILPWNNIAEFTFECAPRSVRKEFLLELKRLGVTRVSMGVQSFDNDLLKANGRIHAVDDVLRAYAGIQEVGFDTVNLDLMCGLLGESEDQWAYSVRRMIQLAPDSITIYQTEIPYNTTLYRKLTAGGERIPTLPWETKRERLCYGFSELEQAGYTVISAYQAVKAPHEHPFQYQNNLWYGEDMLGLGVAAFGYLGGTHVQNEITLEAYQRSIDQKNLPLGRAFQLSQEDQITREFILQLKTGKVEKGHFRKRFGVAIDQVMQDSLARLSALGLLTVKQDSVELSRQGLLQADRLLPEFYHTKYQNCRYT